MCCVTRETVIAPRASEPASDRGAPAVLRFASNAPSSSAIEGWSRSRDLQSPIVPGDITLRLRRHGPLVGDATSPSAGTGRPAQALAARLAQDDLHRPLGHADRKEASVEATFRDAMWLERISVAAPTDRTSAARALASFDQASTIRFGEAEPTWLTGGPAADFAMQAREALAARDPQHIRAATAELHAQLPNALAYPARWCSGSAGPLKGLIPPASASAWRRTSV